VRRVIGVELVPAAVEDARANAERNGVSNATFIAGKAETATRQLLETLTEDEKEHLVAVVDPPRAGLHTDVIRALRSCHPLRRLLFVSCHAPAFVQNAVSLCRPASHSFHGLPFVPVRAFPVDLFPHTEHCELVVLLERPSEQRATKGRSPALAELAPSPAPQPAAAPEAIKPESDPSGGGSSSDATPAEVSAEASCPVEAASTGEAAAEAAAPMEVTTEAEKAAPMELTAEGTSTAEPISEAAVPTEMKVEGASTGAGDVSATDLPDTKAKYD